MHCCNARGGLIWSTNHRDRRWNSRHKGLLNANLNTSALGPRRNEAQQRIFDMLKKLIFVALALAQMTTAAQAISRKSAIVLGKVLASEGPCGLTYDQEAIGNWIDKNTDPSDLVFPSYLSIGAASIRLRIKTMSTSSKTAHCLSVERTARYLGFIK
jgi:hypothetical protein